jgi:hypothetical protein
MQRALSLVLFAGLASGACSSNNETFEGSCSATSFQVFHSGAPVSVIPMCTDAIDAGETDGELSTSPGIDAAFDPFAGAPPLSVAGLKQCAAICTMAIAPVPCCQSQWLPETIVCAPACSSP